MASVINQNFVQIPHAKLIEMLIYKAELVGIRVISPKRAIPAVPVSLIRMRFQIYDPNRAEEPHFSGRRDGRWYYASGKRRIHSDVNGSYNIGRKVVPTA